MTKLTKVLTLIGMFALVILIAKPALAAEVTIEHPDAGSTMSPQESIYGSVSEAPDSVAVKYQASGGAWQTACASANIDALTWDCTWNTASLASGNYNIRADATIGGAVSSSASLTVVVSNAAAGATPTASSASGSTTKATATPKTSASASASVSPSTTPVAATTDDTTSNSNNTLTYILIAVGVVVVGGGVTYFILKGKKKPPVA